jgi:hypothetical protein
MPQVLVLGMLIATASGGLQGPASEQLARVETAGSTAEVALGKQGRLVVEISPTGTPEAPTHLETAFPTRLALTAPPDVRLAKEKLAKADAARMERQTIRFEIPLTASSPGRHEISGRVDFAVCVEDPKTNETLACYPQRREITHAVTVR